MRRLASLATSTATAVALVVTPALTAPALAHGPVTGPAVDAERTASALVQGTAAGRRLAAAGRGARPSTVRPAPVTVVGVVSGVGSAGDPSSATVTVSVKSGDKAYRGKTVTLTVDERAQVRRNGQPVAGGALRGGDKVAVRATRVGEALHAVRVVAVGPRTR